MVSGKWGHKYLGQIIPRSFVAWGVINFGTQCVKHLWSRLSIQMSSSHQRPPPLWPRPMGQSQPPPEVVPLVSSPAEDRAQPATEQVAPPMATDVCPVLSSSGENAPLSAAEVGDYVNISDSGNPVTSGNTIKARRKRRRVNGDTERNVKKKLTTSTESPHYASSPVASNDDITLSPRIPRRRRGVTRYTAAKQQWNDAWKKLFVWKLWFSY